MHTILLDLINFEGHVNIKATNTSTLEVTKEDFLTPRGDCIIGVSSDKACADLTQRAKSYLTSNGSRVLIKIFVDKEVFNIHARGDSRLILTNDKSIVIRKSSFICPRTLVIESSASASDLSRSIVKSLIKGSKGRMEIYAILDDSNLSRN
ncbi:MAG: DUF371 domain-containing protein [Conexivisphaerales archaeon]